LRRSVPDGERHVVDQQSVRRGLHRSPTAPPRKC
jgi:hypothetical protein